MYFEVAWMLRNEMFSVEFYSVFSTRGRNKTLPVKFHLLFNLLEKQYRYSFICMKLISIYVLAISIPYHYFLSCMCISLLPINLVLPFAIERNKISVRPILLSCRNCWGRFAVPSPNACAGEGNRRDGRRLHRDPINSLSAQP